MLVAAHVNLRNRALRVQMFYCQFCRVLAQRNRHFVRAGNGLWRETCIGV